jgi:hypothetical protein
VLVVNALLPGPVCRADALLSNSSDPSAQAMSLWYRQAAAEWTEALPVGNGRIGCMVFGGVNRERIQLNEGTLWAGGPYDPVNPDAKAALPEVRSLIFAGRYDEAANLVASRVLSKPLKQMPYEPVGDLYLDLPTETRPESYRRDLNLDTAIATTTYKANGVTFTREVFSSAVDQVIVIHLTADKPGKISFKASLATPQRANVKVDTGDTLVMKGMNGDANGISGALKFESRTKVLAVGGTTTSLGEAVTVTDADSATANHCNRHELQELPRCKRRPRGDCKGPIVRGAVEGPCWAFRGLGRMVGMTRFASSMSPLIKGCSAVSHLALANPNRLNCRQTSESPISQKAGILSLRHCITNSAATY